MQVALDVASLFDTVGGESAVSGLRDPDVLGIREGGGITVHQFVSTPADHLTEGVIHQDDAVL